MPSGGSREGSIGGKYPNRSDLRQPKAPVMKLGGQDYGVQTQQVAQQQIQAAAPGPPPGVQGGWTPPPAPTPLHAPTLRPDEPVTHGLTTGPGAGPEVLDHADNSDDLLFALRAAYDAFPSPDLVRLMLDEEARRG